MLGHSAADNRQYAMRLPIQYGVCSPVMGKPRTECQVQGVPITHRLEIQLHNHSPPVQLLHGCCCSPKSRQAEYAAFPVPEGYIVLAVGYDFAKAKFVQPTTPARTLRFGQLSLLTDALSIKLRTSYHCALPDSSSRLFAQRTYKMPDLFRRLTVSGQVRHWGPL